MPCGNRRAARLAGTAGPPAPVKVPAWVLFAPAPFLPPSAPAAPLPSAAALVFFLGYQYKHVFTGPLHQVALPGKLLQQRRAAHQLGPLPLHHFNIVEVVLLFAAQFLP